MTHASLLYGYVNDCGVLAFFAERGTPNMRTDLRPLSTRGLRAGSSLFTPYLQHHSLLIAKSLLQFCCGSPLLPGQTSYLLLRLRVVSGDHRK